MGEGGRKRGARRIPSQIGEMGALAVSFLVIFLISSVDLPIFASCSLANLRFARRCWGVCACCAGSAWAVVMGGGREAQCAQAWDRGAWSYHCEVEV